MYWPSALVSNRAGAVARGAYLARASTGYVERKDLTIGRGIRLFRQLANAPRTKDKNLACATPLHFSKATSPDRGILRNGSLTTSSGQWRSCWGPTGRYIGSHIVTP